MDPSTAEVYDYSSADGFLHAERVVTMSAGIASPEFRAFAVFWSDSAVHVGQVSLNGSQLLEEFSVIAGTDTITVETPGYYSTSDQGGLDLASENASWVVEGGNGFMGFTHSASDISYPHADTVTSSGTLHLSAGYVLTCGSVSGADSVTFQVGYRAKTLPGNATSCAFTASELNGLTAGSTGMAASIRAGKYSHHATGGKHLFFNKAFVSVKPLEIVN